MILNTYFSIATNGQGNGWSSRCLQEETLNLKQCGAMVYAAIKRGNGQEVLTIR